VNYLTVDIRNCAKRGHHFKLVGSHKTPMKRHLICETCCANTGKSCYAAYGVEEKSFGEWRKPAVHVEPEML